METLAGLPLIVNETPLTIQGGGDGGQNPMLSRVDEDSQFTDEDNLFSYDRSA